MNPHRIAVPLVLLLACRLTTAATTQPAMPRDWIDPATGHRIIRLSDEDGSESFYFHQNAYTPDGKTLVITTPQGISAVDLQTRKIESIVTGKAMPIIVGRKTDRIFYRLGNDIYAADVRSKQSSKIAALPASESETVNIDTVNADETLLGGTVTHRDDPPAIEPTSPPLSKAARINARFDLRLPMELITIDIASGKMSRFNASHDWLNHVQFSPTDPQLLLFCHEGPWHKVDRTWTIRADGSGLTQIHQRTMAMEIEGHEFFSRDGSTVWYDLQTPRGEDFWLGGLNLVSGQRTWFHLQRDEWSVHYNVSPDGALFAGDGGGPGMVAHAPDGKWIYLFRPEMTRDLSEPQIDSSHLIHTGVFRSEKLVDMSKHDYSLEPNVTFTPDGKWIVFRSNMFGAEQVFEVEIERARG